MSEPQAIGPIYTGGLEDFVTTEEGNSYRILYLPDKKNPELNEAGKSPHYYWMMDGVRIAKDPANGNYMFNLTMFAGQMDEDTHLGVEESEEVAGGVLSMTTTGSPPSSVLKKSHEQLKNEMSGKQDKYFGWRNNKEPKFAPIPLSEATTSITNLTPGGGGAGGGGSGGGGSGGSSAGGSSGGGGGPGSGGGPGPGPRSRNGTTGPPVQQPRLLRQRDRSNRPVSSSMSTDEQMPRTITIADSRQRRSNLDRWYSKLEGGGRASIDPAGENAFSGLLGAYPAAILWEGFHGVYSPVSVRRDVKMMVWSPEIKLEIHGNWERMFQHFSTHANAEGIWSSAEIEAEFERLVADGNIEVELWIDGTRPGSDELLENIRQHKQQIVKIFLEQSKDIIFEEKPDVEAAEAEGGLITDSGWAVKGQLETTEIEMSYTETINRRYNQRHSVSSTLKGFFDEIKQDPEAENKYFNKLWLSEYWRKVTRVVKPVVNWPHQSKGHVGDPVEMVSAQIGYPDSNGELMWSGEQFTGSDDAEWNPAFARKNLSDVSEPPENWAPDDTYIKRRVHFQEPPGENDAPYTRQFIEKDIVEIDSGEMGTLTDNTTIEVRADATGKLEVGPISLDVVLENEKQFVEVEIKPLGKKDDGSERSITRFQFTSEDEDEDRFLEIFTGQDDFEPEYKYRVRVVVRSTIFSDGQEWVGPWNDVVGNGPLMVSVPGPDDSGVERRSLTKDERTVPITEVERKVGAETEAGEAEKPTASTTGTAEASKPRAGDRSEAAESETADKPRKEQPPSEATAAEERPQPDGEEPEELPTVGGWNIDSET